MLLLSDTSLDFAGVGGPNSQGFGQSEEFHLDRLKMIWTVKFKSNALDRALNRR